jgi:methylglutaconyl-CoA hydratase
MRRLLAASGRCAPATRTHHGLFARAIQILAPPDPVSLHKLSAPDCEIVELRLERPEVKNAINWEAMRLLRGVVEKVEADDTVKVVLVTSSVPGVFCAGADLKERKLMSSSGVREYANSLRSTFSSFEVCIYSEFTFFFVGIHPRVDQCFYEKLCPLISDPIHGAFFFMCI